MKLIERIAEHYDVQEMPLARTYRWSPEQVVLKCSKCGKTITYKRSEVVGSEVLRCECGEANTACIRDELIIQVSDAEYKTHQHPWRHWITSKDSGIPA